MILVIDTETSGKADFRAPYYAPYQPRMLSVCALLYTPAGELVNHLSAVIKHGKNIVIAPDAAEKNGFTHEILAERGLPMSVVLAALDSMFQLASIVTAYNTNFDRLIIDSEFHRARRLPPIDGTPDLETFCCMEAVTPICRIPSQTNAGQFKWPKLTEAYKHLFNEDHVGAHGAGADALACARIYFELQKRKAQS